jgi:hypothetical protein
VLLQQLLRIKRFLSLLLDILSVFLPELLEFPVRSLFISIVTNGKKEGTGTHPLSRFRCLGPRTKWFVARIPKAGRRVKEMKRRESKAEERRTGMLIRWPRREKLQVGAGSE